MNYRPSTVDSVCAEGHRIPAGQPWCEESAVCPVCGQRHHIDHPHRDSVEEIRERSGGIPDVALALDLHALAARQRDEAVALLRRAVDVMDAARFHHLTEHSTDSELAATALQSARAFLASFPEPESAEGGASES